VRAAPSPSDPIREGTLFGTCSKVKKVKGGTCYSFILETRFRATERHLPYGIAQSYVPPDTGERVLL